MFQENENSELKEFLNEYDKCWQERNIEKIQSFYPKNSGELIFFDNHKNNDTCSVDEHLKLVNDFFQNGKKTESGKVEEILMEKVKYYTTENAACICYYARYKSYPTPAVRTTMYLEREMGKWKIMHVHCSFEPEK